MASKQNHRQNSHDTGDQVIIEEKHTKSNGDVVVKKFIKGKFLGKGGFAKCFEFRPVEGGSTSAVKVVEKASLTKKRAKQKLMSEIKIHRSLRHAHVVGFEHFFEDADNVYIILELCSNQTLNELIRRRKRLHELEAQCYILQMISALEYLHSHRVIHRDLKLGNLFLNDKMEIKLGDFGLATKLDFEGEKKRTICGTPNYIAPEIIEGKVGHSYEVDIWSLGIIIYTLIIGRPPFETPDVKTTYKRIRMNNYSFPENAHISDEAKSLIKSILVTNPASRPNLKQILNHDFFSLYKSVPRTMPVSTLACPPPIGFLRQFLKDPDSASNSKNETHTRFESTAPLGSSSAKPYPERNLMNTDRGANLKGISRNGSQGGARDNNSIKGTAGGESHRDRQATSSRGSKVISPRGDERIATARKEEFLRTDSQPKLSQGGLGTGNKSKGMPSDVWVKKWVDYSSKYGIGYLLSNKATGVFFNDSTKIILDPNGHNFDYMERRSSDRQDVVYSHSLSHYPKALQKKVTLLQHFRSYLDGETKPGSEANTDNNAITPVVTTGGEKAPPMTETPVYVKKWMRTNHAIMFRLSNKIVQVNFKDRTEIVLNSETRLVTYLNKRGERSTHPLSTALESSNQEMAKRLKYTKDILTHMIQNNGSAHAGTGGSSDSKTGRDSADQKLRTAA
eukprot:CAMPEP_0115009622 /NCGR_PEP_ID=MMETSP0216-20121206/22751_1 /TAXON_ID=223996 /ORGANISM="Protocruzia adherens, Strain Boccale" /LENGTH=677 /DNA_ID=CAMNT_0002377523 /DNA_START=60 /DNA_END=2093 /DNA_ORIENTATION=+